VKGSILIFSFLWPSFPPHLTSKEAFWSNMQIYMCRVFDFWYYIHLLGGKRKLKVHVQDVTRIRSNKSQTGKIAFSVKPAQVRTRHILLFLLRSPFHHQPFLMTSSQVFSPSFNFTANPREKGSSFFRFCVPGNNHVWLLVISADDYEDEDT